MASVKLTYADPETGSTANTQFDNVLISRGWYDVDEIQIHPGIQNAYLSGNKDEQIAGFRRIITLDMGVVTDFAKRKAILYFTIDPARIINLILSAPTNPLAGVPIAGGSLANSTTYYWKITGVDSIGETTGSAEVNVTIGVGANRTEPLSWDSMAGATSYRIYRSTTSGSYSGAHYLTEVTTNSYNDDGSITLTSTHQLPTVQALTVALENFQELKNEWLDGYENAKKFVLRVSDAKLRTTLIP